MASTVRWRETSVTTLSYFPFLMIRTPFREESQIREVFSCISAGIRCTRIEVHFLLGRFPSLRSFNDEIAVRVHLGLLIRKNHHGGIQLLNDRRPGDCALHVECLTIVDRAGDGSPGRAVRHRSFATLSPGQWDPLRLLAGKLHPRHAASPDDPVVDPLDL